MRESHTLYKHTEVTHALLYVQTKLFSLHGFNAGFISCATCSVGRVTAAVTQNRSDLELPTYAMTTDGPVGKDHLLDFNNSNSIENKLDEFTYTAEH